jgi:ferrous iron transport protein B
MQNKKLNIALAGQANVGKSVIFNYLTGLHQHIGNWPGKTVEKAEGTLHYRGYTIDIVDLPGIYSLTTYSIEEIVSREYIAIQNPDFIINVVDATNLERNLIFTLQLLEMEKPMALSLNMVNLLKKKRMAIDITKLEMILGVPVIPTIAIHGKGLTKVLDCAIESAEREKEVKPLKYGQEVEEKIAKLAKKLINLESPYPPRWLAIKLLEKDNDIGKIVEKNRPDLLKEAEILCRELEDIHGHDSSLVIAGERCFLASQITEQVLKTAKSKNKNFTDILDSIICHKIWGYPTMLALLGFIFYVIFIFANWASSFLGNLTFGLQSGWEHFFGISISSLLLWSAVESAMALLSIALPYIVPFYLILFLLENFGYLARVAFLMDSLMHKMGIHGKACIPMIMGFGCNVPACLSCRIMETEKERFITGFLTTLIPCSAKTIIVMGLVAKFVGIGWAFGLYAFLFLLIFIIGKTTSKVLPGESVELIMEMPDYRIPNLKAVFLQTWFRVKEFLFIAAPLVIILGIAIKAISLAGWLDAIANFLSPVTVDWLGLPAICGVLLIFGILRKELILVMLAGLLGTANFAQILTPLQMIVLALVSLLYFPCVATVTVFWHEFGWKKTIIVIAVELTLAILLGGLAYRLLKLFFV